MKIDKLDLIGIDVKNLDEAERFFSDLLGTSFVRIPLEEVGFKKTIAGHADQAYEEVKIRFAISPIGLELIESAPPVEREGLRNIDVRVPDLEQAKAEMKIKGIRLLSELTVGGSKIAIYNPEDLHGVRLLLVEYEAPNITSAMLTKMG